MLDCDLPVYELVVQSEGEDEVDKLLLDLQSRVFVLGGRTKDRDGKCRLAIHVGDVKSFPTQIRVSIW